MPTLSGLPLGLRLAALRRLGRCASFAPCRPFVGHGEVDEIDLVGLAREAVVERLEDLDVGESLGLGRRVRARVTPGLPDGDLRAASRSRKLFFGAT